LIYRSSQNRTDTHRRLPNRRRPWWKWCGGLPISREDGRSWTVLHVDSGKNWWCWLEMIVVEEKRRQQHLAGDKDSTQYGHLAVNK
jgi:hypothetical protein